MTDFDDPFADRVREAFDTYEEPVDEAAWVRTRAALASGAGAPENGAVAAVPASGADRAPVARQRPLARRRWAAPLALALLFLAAGIGVWSVREVPGSSPTIASVSPPEASPALTDSTPEADSLPDVAASARQNTDAATAPESPEATASGRGRAATAPRRSPDAPRASQPQREETVEPASGDRVQTADASGEEGDRPQTADRAPAITPEAPIVGLPPIPGSSDPAPSSEQPPSVLITQTMQIPGLPASTKRAPEAQPSDTRGFSFVAASTSTFSNGSFADGLGGAAGVTHEWAFARGLSVSGSALAAYNQFTLEPGGNGVPFAVRSLELDPSREIDVPERIRLTTLALEVPVDVALDVFSTPRGRVGLAVGVTSAVYLAQSVREVGDTYSADVVSDPSGDQTILFQAQSYNSQETRGALSRLDLARQLNLALRFASADAPLALEGYARLPLGGLTSQDLALTTLGLRLRVALK